MAESYKGEYSATDWAEKVRQFIERKEVNPEFIKEVENSGFPAEEKFYILLVRAGLKPAAHVSFNARVYGHGRDDRRVSEEVAQASVQMIEKSGLFYKREEGKDDGLRMGFTLPDGTDVEYEREHVSYLIAHTQQDLDKVKLASDQGNDELMGEVFGYPKTAVDAYSRKEFLDLEKLPEKFKKSPAMLFCRFRLSANNWEEELRQVQDQADFVKENSPKIYKEMIEEGRNLERTREKERVYKETQEKVEQIPSMEKGVVKIVTILNVLGVSTSQSCEGHLDIEEDTRIIRPFVEISSSGQPEKRFVGQERIIPKVAKKYGMKEEDVRTMLLHSAPWEEFQNAKETEKYKAWRKENKKIAKRGEKILKEFYQDTAVPETDRLIINEQNSGQFEITNVGRGQEDRLPANEQNLTPEQRAALEQQLSLYQNQMDNFAGFLKEKYFTK